MYSGHNFDYPTIFGPGMINAQFVKGGKKVYEGSVVAGTIGVMAGLATAKGHFAVSIDQRDAHKPTLADAVRAAQGGAYGFEGIARKAMEAAASYDEAVKFLTDTPMISPVYLIVGGTEPGQGAVVTTNSSGVGNDVWPLKDAGGWYLVETNYDHWNPAPDRDNRRDPAIKRLEAIGSADISLLGLLNILSSPPNYRGATVTTHLVDIRAGVYRTYLRHSI